VISIKALPYSLSFKKFQAVSGGNDFFNKISRISLSRIYIEIGKYDDALSQLSVYSESSANAYIHELIGDIFAAKQEVEKSIEQYMLADEKYDDQQSKSIIAMKIADLES
jgi:predicted negative regulator of RcsB-dependent stress response